jgi:formylglycine-generating enzyme required for sulfatase activity
MKKFIGLYLCMACMMIVFVGCDSQKEDPLKAKVMPLLNDFVKVEGGRFMMGSADSEPDRNKDEGNMR